jgi:hypothetical protein
MTKSERAVEDLRLALGGFDYLRASQAAMALQETGTISDVVADRLVRALGTIRDIVSSFPKTT